MATLLSRVRSATGSTTTQTSDAQVVTFIQSGVQYAISGLPKELQWQFASAGTDITSNAGQRPASDTVLSVTRNGFSCREIPIALAYAQNATYSPSSLLAATALFPVYYKDKGLIYIKPDPTVSAVGVITSVAIPTIVSGTTDTWSFKVIDQIIINYASALDSMGVGSYWRKQGETAIAAQSTTNVEDALTKAQVLIDNNSGIDFESYMAASEEDDLQSKLTIEAAAEEVNRAGQEIAKLQINQGQTARYYETAQVSFQNAVNFFQEAAAELKMYIENNSRMINLKASVQSRGNVSL